MRCQGFLPFFIFAQEEGGAAKMGDYTRIYNKFEWWSVDDCRCEYCRFYCGKKKPCPLETCDIEDIRREAFMREYGGYGDKGTVSCLA